VGGRGKTEDTSKCGTRGKLEVASSKTPYWMEPGCSMAATCLRSCPRFGFGTFFYRLSDP
jgi:hypothetical protein